MGVTVITVGDVEGAQEKWGDGIVAIATAHSEGGDYNEIARSHVRELYAYDIGEVLFKPTLASVEQFRPNFESALSYFVAMNGECPEDKGFAIKGWTGVRFENEGVVIYGKTALAMGNYFFTDREGYETKVEYSFGYVIDDTGGLRIQLHHSSIPASET